MTQITDIVNNECKKCIICNHEGSVRASKHNDNYAFNCPICGYYEISEQLFRIHYDEEILLNFFRKAPAILAERKLHKLDNCCINDFDEFLKGYPENFIEKMDRTLINIAYEANFEPKEIQLCTEDFGKLFIEHSVFWDDSPNLEIMLQHLADEKMITYSNVADVIFSVKLTIAGLKHVAELQKIYKDKNKVFIAMWFNNKTELFRQATKEAIEKAGYKAEIVNENHHNDFIMDKVINLINDSKFVIADLTSIPEKINDVSSGIRGGVYYEAGYAKGLGLPVIFTCEKDSHNRVHFDLQQMNTILWYENDNILMTSKFNYVDYLTEHIIATVGRGPFFK